MVKKIGEKRSSRAGRPIRIACNIYNKNKIESNDSKTSNMYDNSKNVIEMNGACSNYTINTDNETIINNQPEHSGSSRRTDRIHFHKHKNSRNNNIDNNYNNVDSVVTPNNDDNNSRYVRIQNNRTNINNDKDSYNNLSIIDMTLDNTKANSSDTSNDNAINDGSNNNNNNNSAATAATKEAGYSLKPIQTGVLPPKQTLWINNIQNKI
uniref:Uncharacterized protein n=1 Tax=Octopus bimaculoides TaxID=37653 RepID=A0A0L8HQ21_OCTBM